MCTGFEPEIRARPSNYAVNRQCDVEMVLPHLVQVRYFYQTEYATYL